MNQESKITKDRRQEIMRQLQEGMRATSGDEMARRQLEAAKGMRNAWPDCIDHARGQAAILNLWRDDKEKALRRGLGRESLG